MGAELSIVSGVVFLVVLVSLQIVQDGTRVLNHRLVLRFRTRLLLALVSGDAFCIVDCVRNFNSRRFGPLFTKHRQLEISLVSELRSRVQLRPLLREHMCLFKLLDQTLRGGFLSKNSSVSQP